MLNNTVCLSSIKEKLIYCLLNNTTKHNKIIMLLNKLIKSVILITITTTT
jgi:hypothetical protein